MKQNPINADYLFEVSWEVCNKVGGIYAVLSTKAASLQSRFGDNLIFVGPDLWDKNHESPFFESCATTTALCEWADKANAEGLKVRLGRWKVPGNPIVVLVDFRPFFNQKNTLYGNMWEWYGVNSIAAYGDYDEGCVFAYASAVVIESLHKHLCPQRSNVVAHFNEWTTGMGVLYLKHQVPSIATVFTTHATCVGRSICGNNKPLYDYLPGYNGDQMAEELNMVSKHSVEKTAALEADCFTTVSEITARECEQLLGRKPLVTPNGFESEFVPKGVSLGREHRDNRAVLSRLVECLSGKAPADDAVFIGTAGRCEYKNKGIDVILDTIASVRYLNPDREVVLFIMVPGWIQEPRADLRERLESNKDYNFGLGDPVFTHAIYNYFDDVILNRIHQLGFRNDVDDKVKVVYVPCYLNGDDGLLNRTYYSLLSALDLTIYPSYYEPWGYTPMESCAFSVPTITTSLSGFGMWCQASASNSGITEGVVVIPRSDHNYSEVVSNITDVIMNYLKLPSTDVRVARSSARKLSLRASWNRFMKFYDKAYAEAINHSLARVKE